MVTLTNLTEEQLKSLTKLELLKLAYEGIIPEKLKK